MVINQAIVTQNMQACKASLTGAAAVCQWNLFLVHPQALHRIMSQTIVAPWLLALSDFILHTPLPLPSSPGTDHVL